MDTRPADQEGPFIGAELRPEVGIEELPPLDCDASPVEVEKRIGKLVGGERGVRLGLDEPPRANLWQTRFFRREEVTWQVLDGEGILLDLDSSLFYSLNVSGTEVWELLDGDRPLEEILRTLCERFEVTEQVARGDLAAFVQRLCRERLISSSEEASCR